MATLSEQRRRFRGVSTMCALMMGAIGAMKSSLALAEAAPQSTTEPQDVQAAASANPVLAITYILPLRLTLASPGSLEFYSATSLPQPTQPANPFSRLATIASGGPLGNVGRFKFDLRNGIVGVTTFDTRLEVSGQSSLMDLRLEIKGDKALQQDTGMALTYDGAAFLIPDAPVALGVVSKGAMGTLGDPIPVEEGFAGPAARVCLPGVGRGFMAETGFLFSVGEKAVPARNQFSLQLHLSL